MIRTQVPMIIFVVSCLFQPKKENIKLLQKHRSLSVHVAMESEKEREMIEQLTQVHRQLHVLALKNFTRIFVIIETR